MSGLEGPQQLNLDLQPMITETKLFDFFSSAELREFKKAISDGRVSPELVARFKDWEDREREIDRESSNPRYGH